MAKKFKIGVMGLVRGRFVLRCAENLSDYMEVVAACEIDPAAIEETKKQGILPDSVKLYEDYDEFINSGLDAVVLCNFFTDHAKCAIKAMEAGVAVLSETTAAPTLGECVELVEAYERTNTKYMLAANCVFHKVVQAMRNVIDSNRYGTPVYGDAEYVHPPETKNAYRERDPKNTHWRDTLPTCYYNMHDLGPMMYITNGIPRKVVSKAIITPKEVQVGRLRTSDKSFNLVEFDNGMVINYAGATSIGAAGKWYRVGCQFGTVESERFAEGGNLITCGLNHDKKDPEETRKEEELTWSSCGALTPEEEKKFFEGVDIEKLHGGGDLVLLYNFIKYLADEKEPFFDIYHAVALSATGIMAWYSALLGSRELEIPDFKDKASRDKVRNDFRTPFAKDVKDVSLPYRLEDKDKFTL